MASSPMTSITNPAQNMIRKLLLACLLPLWLFPAMAQGETLYYNIAHAINHSKYIDWAVQEGANAIEADLRFSDSGEVVKFQHGAPCECKFLRFLGKLPRVIWNETDICRQMVKVDPLFIPDPKKGKVERIRSGDDACLVHETAPSFMNTLARNPSIALFIVDSKVGDSVADNDTAKAAAGNNVIATLIEELFEKDYKGNVIVGVDKASHQAYIKAAAAAARGTKYEDRIYFSFDETGVLRGWITGVQKWLLGSPVERTIELLHRLAPDKGVYGNGISANLEVIGGLTDTFRAGVAAERGGRLRMNYIWTLDARNPMDHYLSLGVRGIMTNSPRTLKEVMQTYLVPLPNGRRMARPGDPL